MDQNLSLEEITRIGEKYYLEELREKLEISDFGKYVVLDVELKKHVINVDRLAAIKEAQKELGEKIFYIVQVGMLKEPTINYLEKKHAWVF